MVTPGIALGLALLVQHGDSLPRTPHTVRWYQAAAAAAGVALLLPLDEPLQRYAQRRRSPASDDAASVLRHAGQPEVFGTVSLGLLAAGLVERRSGLVRAAGRLVASVGLAQGSTSILKEVTGRARPDAGLGAFDWDPFSGRASFPSGHTTTAFALAADLADELDRGWARVGLYGLAAGTAFSRINDNRHWASDAGMGALIGITSAKLVGGRWRVFGLTPPGFLIGPRGAAAIGWRRSL